jgi:hypothetical protein
VPEPELFRAPDDLSLVSAADLRELETQGVTEFDRVRGKDQHSDDDLTYTRTITSGLKKIRAELALREQRATETARIEQEERSRQLAALEKEITPGDGSGTDTAVAAADGSRVDLAALTEAMAKGVVLGLQGEEGAKRFASLSAVRERAPQPKVPDGSASAITASVDIPGVAAGQTLPTMEALGEAFRQKAKAIPTTMAGKGAAKHLVASVRNQFEHTIDNRTNPADVEALHRALTQEGGRADTAEALVAAGGWCAPSQISYDFFNIASATPRTIDLPTVGVSRGGIRFPVSPAIGDVFFQAGGSNPASGLGGFAFPFANTSDPWLWSESDDALTVTGSVNKPTLRVPCPSFSEVRLECYGLSLTAGNLTDDAYPESTQNFIRLLRAAYAHAINARLIGLMVAASGGANTLSGNVADAAVPQIINSVGLAATDYRNRYAMGEDDVLEVVFPQWVLEAMRSDLGYKPGLQDTGMYAVPDATIMGLFAARNVRVQFVSDWQVRGTPGVSAFGTSTVATTWPTAANFMLYAAGTFLHGTGLQLDLGVIRDSVLNAENDFTALWAEECHLIAQVGHASRLYTVNFNVGGDIALGVTRAKV